MTLISSVLLFALVNSPLANASHYVYTQLSNRAHMVTGKLIGTDPKGHPPLRGEDILYLQEAVTELAYVYGGTYIGSLRSRKITRPYAGVELLDLLKMKPMKSRLYTDKEIEGEPNLVAYGMQGETNAICSYATDAVVRSNAEPVFDPACSNLYADIIVSGIIAPKVDDIAGLYRTLKQIKGVAYDAMSNPTNTQQKALTGIVQRVNASWDSENEDWTYKSEEYDTAYFATAPISYFYASLRSSMKQQAVSDEDGKTHAVRTGELTYKSEIDGYMDGTLKVQLIPKPDERLTYAYPSSSFSVRKCWIAYEMRAYMSTSTERMDSQGNHTTTYETLGTNVYAVIEVPGANVSFVSDKSANGPVAYAYIDTDINGAYMRLFSLLPMSLKLYESVPQMSASSFGGYEGTTTLGNSRTTTYTVRPYSVSILVDVDWHSGWSEIE